MVDGSSNNEEYGVIVVELKGLGPGISRNCRIRSCGTGPEQVLPGGGNEKKINKNRKEDQTEEINSSRRQSEGKPGFKWNRPIAVTMRQVKNIEKKKWQLVPETWNTQQFCPF